MDPTELPYPASDSSAADPPGWQRHQKEDWPEELDRNEGDEIWEESWGDRQQELVIIGARMAGGLIDQH